MWRYGRLDSWYDVVGTIAESKGMVGTIGAEAKGARHVRNYIMPHLSKAGQTKTIANFGRHVRKGFFPPAQQGPHAGKDWTHTLASSHGEHKAGTKVQVRHVSYDKKTDSIHAHTAKHGIIPISRLSKPESLKKVNKDRGFQIENRIQKNLGGGKAAGSSEHSFDFNYRAAEGGAKGRVANLKAKKTDPHPDVKGESKLVKGKLGESTVQFDKEKKKWDIRHPDLKHAFAKATHPETGLKMLDHLNKHHPKGVIKQGISFKAAKGTAKAYFDKSKANMLHFHHSDEKKKIDRGTTYSYGNELKGATKHGHLHDEDIHKLDNTVAVEGTTNGKTHAVHRPKIGVMRDLADASHNNPNQHRGLDNPNHAKEFMTDVDKHIAKNVKTVPAV